MEAQTKNCQVCKTDFIIEPGDFAFYDKLQVPPPTLCPDCRQRKRYAWRNERTLYLRPCDLCGKNSVSIYSADKPFKVYCPKCWWSDGWSGFDFAQDFDFSRPFFPQWQELQYRVPRIALLSKNSINSEYTNHSNNNKNCYLCASVFGSENILHSANVLVPSKDCMDCYLASGEGGAELCYELVDSARVYNCQYGALLKDCTDCFYSYDLHGCSNCFLSHNLRNKQYCFLNEELGREEYLKKIGELGLGTWSARREFYKQFLDMLRTRVLHRFAVIEKSVNVSGNVIHNSKNSQHIFDADKVEDAKYCILTLDSKDMMDAYHFGYTSELIYESDALIHGYNIKFTHLSYDNSHLEYCDSCHNSENLFGCIGVRHGGYCILNKRYEEAEYVALKEKIIAHMKATGEYGQFFPPALCPFGYNETQANYYMPLAKEEALALGFKWQDKLPGTYGKETIKPEQIPDDIKDVPDTILKEALVCEICKRNYNLPPAELGLYRQMNLPVSRICPECRYRRRLALRPSRKLWHRKCMHEGCQNEFETPYAPERPEIIYCESCYQQEVV